MKPEPHQLSDSEKRAAFVRDFKMQLAMWADENLFGHGLTDEAYEAESMMLADELHESTYRVLETRPERTDILRSRGEDSRG